MNKTYRFLNPYSSVKDKAPSAETMYFGEIYVNGNADAPHLYIKNTNNKVVTFTPIEVSSSVTSGDTNPVQGGAIYDVITENERVIANALNALNNDKQNVLTAGSGISISGDVISVTGGGITSEECQSMIDQSISGKIDTSDFNVYSAATDTTLGNKQDVSGMTAYTQTTAFTAHTADTTIHHTATSAVTANSTDVLTSGGAYAQFGGLKLVKLTQSAYDNLLVKDSMTVYIIID